MKPVHRIKRTAEEVISLSDPGYLVTVRLPEGRVPTWLNIRRESSTILHGKNSCGGYHSFSKRMLQIVSIKEA